MTERGLRQKDKGQQPAPSPSVIPLSQAEAGSYAIAVVNICRAIELITRFARPGTTYSDWQDDMKHNLPILEKLADVFLKIDQIIS